MESGSILAILETSLALVQRSYSLEKDIWIEAKLILKNEMERIPTLRDLEMIIDEFRGGSMESYHILPLYNYPGVKGGKYITARFLVSWYRVKPFKVALMNAFKQAGLSSRLKTTTLRPLKKAYGEKRLGIMTKILELGTDILFEALGRDVFPSRNFVGHIWHLLAFQAMLGYPEENLLHLDCVFGNTTNMFTGWRRKKKTRDILEIYSKVLQFMRIKI